MKFDTPAGTNPIDAMNVVSLPLMDNRSQQPAHFHIFTTRKSREALLQPEASPKSFSLDLAKEEFFRSQVPFGSIIYREAVRNNWREPRAAIAIDGTVDPAHPESIARAIVRRRRAMSAGPSSPTRHAPVAPTCARRRRRPCTCTTRACESSPRASRSSTPIDRPSHGRTRWPAGTGRAHREPSHRRGADS